MSAGWWNVSPSVGGVRRSASHHRASKANRRPFSRNVRTSAARWCWRGGALTRLRFDVGRAKQARRPTRRVRSADRAGADRAVVGTGRRRRAIMGEVAWASVKRRATYFHAQFHRIARRRGPNKAVVAVAHSLLVVIYHVLQTRQPYAELGIDYFDQLDTARIQRHHVRRLEQLGYGRTLNRPARDAVAYITEALGPANWMRLQESGSEASMISYSRSAARACCIT